MKAKRSAVTGPGKERKTQELGDDLARKVAKGQISMDEAQKIQAKRDAKVRKTKTVKNTTGKGTPKKAGSSFGKERKAKFKRNRHGNLEAY